MKTSPSPLSLAYFRFLQLSRSLKARDCLELSPFQLALLESIALAWHEGSPMAVGEAITLTELGSPATLHKRLAELRQSGFIKVKTIASDRRTKLLVPTEKAIQYFDQLGQVMSLQSLGGAVPSL